MEDDDDGMMPSDSNGHRGFVMDGNVYADSVNQKMNEIMKMLQGEGYVDNLHYNPAMENDDQEIDHDEYENGIEDEVQPIAVDENPPPMPKEYYHEVENFLSKPPPKFTSSDNNKKNEKERKKEMKELKKSSSHSSMLPEIKNSKQSKEKKANGNVGSRRPPRQPNNQGPRMLDISLLQQAFEYVEKLQHDVDLIDEEEKVGIVNERKANSAPTQSSNFDKPTVSERVTSFNLDSHKSEKRSMVKKLRSQTQHTASNQICKENAKGFDTSMSQQDGGCLRNAIDYESLIANFQNGIMLNQLKTELEQSQASMKKSEDYLKSAARDFRTRK